LDIFYSCGLRKIDGASYDGGVGSLPPLGIIGDHMKLNTYSHADGE